MSEYAVKPHGHITIDEDLFHAYQDLERYVSAPDSFSPETVKWQLAKIDKLVNLAVADRRASPAHHLAEVEEK